mgnify:FL=1
MNASGARRLKRRRAEHREMRHAGGALALPSAFPPDERVLADRDHDAVWFR